MKEVQLAYAIGVAQPVSVQDRYMVREQLLKAN